MSWVTAEIEARFWKKVDRSGGLLACWEWQGAYNRPSDVFRRKHGGGVSARPTFSWRTPAGIVTVYAHRLALSLMDDVPLYDREGLEACHRPECSNYRCVNPAHLYWGTPEDNRNDRYKKPMAKMDLSARLGSLT